MVDPPRILDRLNAALSGRYALERQLGEGGMATVYLAEDLKHHRKVALKVLKPELAAVVGAERFLAEIETTANLQHPGILPLYDSGEADSFLYYVMPHVEGESLRDRLDREHQLPVDEAVGIATAVAHALDFAHQHGVIHRDIKPGNILFQGGQPVVGDFGIALALGAGGGGRLTETGLSLGTPYYMSPEQATGDQTVGPKSDIYALGCVLYEMLVGDPPYTGSTAQAVLGQIITTDAVAARKKRPTVPTHVDAVIRRALEKTAADRFATAKEFADALGNRAFRHGDDEEVAGAGGRLRAWKMATAVSGAVALASLAVAYGAFRSGGERGGARTYSLARLTADPSRTQAIISPDGSTFAYIVLAADAPRGVPVTDSSQSHIWIRGRNDLDATPIRGTGGARLVAFSPDSRSLAFTALDTLKVVPVDGGRPVTVTALQLTSGLAWGDDGYLYVSPSSSGDSILRIRPDGSGKARVSVVDRVGGSDAFAGAVAVLPEGRGLVGMRWHGMNLQAAEIYAANPATRTYHAIGTGWDPRYTRSGYLMWIAPNGRLMAAPFDPAALDTVGPAVSIADDALSFSVSRDGDLLYSRGTRESRVPEVLWMDRSGKSEPIEWSFAPGQFPLDPALSPDGSRLALAVPTGSTWDSTRVFVKDLSDGAPTPLMSGGAQQLRPAWSADGRDIGVLSDRVDGRFRLWRQRADGSGQPVALTGPDPDSLDVGPWSPDQPAVVAATSHGLDVVKLDGDSVPRSILKTAGACAWPTLSPDGHWLAYSEAVGGQLRVFVSPFPNVDGGRFPVSEGQGFQPKWSHDGREIFYTLIEGAGTIGLWSARVSTDSGFRVLSHTFLFNTQVGGGTTTDGWNYEVDATGKRFIVVRTRSVLPTVTGLILVQNFPAKVKAKLAEVGR
ncbi:MAG: protein kinase [Gemmatimonadetes bacterium]|nr:protein kinase [Gemmatimonadota bacterium]